MFAHRVGAPAAATAVDAGAVPLAAHGPPHTAELAWMATTTTMTTTTSMTRMARAAASQLCGWFVLAQSRTRPRVWAAEGRGGEAVGRLARRRCSVCAGAKGIGLPLIQQYLW